MSKLEIPKNAGEQLELLGSYDNAQITHEMLHEGLLRLAQGAEIPVISSFCRTKTLQRLQEKIMRSGRRDPIDDIHAGRLLLRRADFPIITKAIFEKWPSPEYYEYSWGNLHAFRDYSNPDTKRSINPDSDHSYKPTHLTIAVPFGARLAEIQLYTVRDFFVYFSTRDAYQQRQRQSRHLNP